MIQITMPTSFEPRLLEGLQDLNIRYAGRSIQVTELFGSLPRTVLGVGRPASSLPAIDRKRFAAHARELRDRGFRLIYLYNGSCSANLEYQAEHRARLLDEMAWVQDLGTYGVVVASPYLIELFRHHFPDLRIHASSICFAKSTKEARHYESLGVKRLILDPDTIRDFPFIRQVRASCPKMEIEVLANHPCLMNCPYETYCYNSVAHASAEQRDSYECFSLLRCNLDKLRAPAPPPGIQMDVRRDQSSGKNLSSSALTR